jgi:predicted amidohydrolase YtcJ
LSKGWVAPPTRTARLLACAYAAAIAACARPPGGGAADLIVTHAAIWTGDSSHPDAEAVAIVGDRIVIVGTAAEVDRWRGASTQVIDANGRRVVPGFNDAHVHFADGGNQLVGVDLRDVTDPAEFARRIIERARGRPGEWILGGRWDERRWPGGQAPSRGAIDDGTNGTPVFVTSGDGTSALANAAALGRAGITERTPDPVGGTIVRNADGLPTGLLRGTAMDAVSRVVPKPSAEERRETIVRALDHAASLGVTSVQDMNPDPADLPIYADLADRAQLSTRLYEIPNETRWFEQARLGLRRGFGSPALRLGAISGDAGPAARDEMLTRLMAADHAGLQLCINTGTNAASALDLLTGVVRSNGMRDRRMRIEHAERVTPAETDRVADVGAVMVVQLSSAPPADLLRRARDRRVAIAIGSDWPSASLNPLAGLANAARVVPIVDAIRAYTSGSAFAEFQDAAKGTITRGALADLVVLSDDILRQPGERVSSAVVVTTIAGGKVVHQRRP